MYSVQLLLDDEQCAALNKAIGKITANADNVRFRDFTQEDCDLLDEIRLTILQRQRENRKRGK